MCENFRFWLPYKKEQLALMRKCFDTEPEFKDGKVDYEALERYYHEHGSYEFLKSLERVRKFTKSRKSPRVSVMSNIIRKGDIIQCDYQHEDGDITYKIVLNIITGELIESSEPESSEYTRHTQEELKHFEKRDPDDFRWKWDIEHWFESVKENIIDKEWPYSYMLSSKNDSAVFIEACSIIENHFPQSEIKEMLVDPDASAYQYYCYNGKEIRVVDDYAVKKVWVDSEINIDDLFAELSVRETL